ncbi:hypothetical protein MMC13_007334 [Lambiella insularis]|nr:hypothetical protein [Lambiella insularis]
MVQALGKLSAAAAALSFIVSTHAEPAVIGMTFTKEVRRDQSQLRRRANSVAASIANEDLLYLINATIGTPPQSFGLQLDTASISSTHSDIWVPATVADVCVQGQGVCSLFGAFNPNASSTFVDIGPNSFSISYVDNSGVTGDFMNDTFSFGGISLKNQQMGLATQSTRALGIMGIGFDMGESSAASTGTTQGFTYPNVVDQLQMQGFIKTMAYSLWLNDLDSNAGSILFGGVDTAKFKAPLISIPIQPDSQTQSISSFTVALSSISVVNNTGATQYSKTNLAVPVILDSGTTLTYLPDTYANDILGGVGAINNKNYGYVVPCSLGSDGANFTFQFGGASGPSIVVGMSEFVIPIVVQSGSTPTAQDGTPLCQFGINPAGNSPNLFGDTFLRSAYVVYDLENQQIGLANTNFNATNSNVQEFTNSQIPGASAAPTNAVVVTQTFSGHLLATTAVAATGGTGTVTGAATGTFVLGSSTAKSTAMRTFGAPQVDLVMVAAGLAGVVSFVFGTSLVFFL